MKHITFIQILKPPGNAIGKMQTGEGRGSKQIDGMLSNEVRGTLLLYRPCTVDESEVNAAGKLDTRRNQEKELLTTMTRLRLESWCGCDTSFLYLFDSYPSSHSSRGVD